MRLRNLAMLGLTCRRVLAGLNVSRFYSSQHLAYEVFDEGKKSEMEPLVIVHGLFGQKRNWKSVAKALQHRLPTTIFTLDLRNHGDSPWRLTMTYSELADDVKRFIEEIVPFETGHSSVHLLGHSLGGKTSMHMSLLPGSDRLLKSLIIEDIAPKNYDTKYHRSFPLLINTLKVVDLSLSLSDIDEQLKIGIEDSVLRQFFLTNLVRDPQGVYQWQVNLDAVGRNLDEICSSGVPSGVFRGKSLFISGSLSNYITSDDHPAIMSKFPCAQFSVIEGAGHWVHADKPYEFIDELVKFIKSTYE